MKKPPIVMTPERVTWKLMLGFVAILCLVAFRSFIAIAAPTDGQTVIVVLPLWGLSYVIWVFCLTMSDKAQRLGVLGLGVFCAVVIALTLYASSREAERIYAERDALRKHE